LDELEPDSLHINWYDLESANNEEEYEEEEEEEDDDDEKKGKKIEIDDDANCVNNERARDDAICRKNATYPSGNISNTNDAPLQPTLDADHFKTPIGTIEPTQASQEVPGGSAIHMHSSSLPQEPSANASAKQLINTLMDAPTQLDQAGAPQFTEGTIHSTATLQEASAQKNASVVEPSLKESEAEEGNQSSTKVPPQPESIQETPQAPTSSSQDALDEPQSTQRKRPSMQTKTIPSSLAPSQDTCKRHCTGPEESGSGPVISASFEELEREMRAESQVSEAADPLPYFAAGQPQPSSEFSRDSHPPTSLPQSQALRESEALVDAITASCGVRIGTVNPAEAEVVDEQNEEEVVSPKRKFLLVTSSIAAGLSSQDLQQLKDMNGEVLNSSLNTIKDANVAVSHVLVDTKLLSNGVVSVRATWKYLLGLGQGAWILTSEWLRACLDDGEWIPEEEYEVRTADLVEHKIRTVRNSMNHTIPLEEYNYLLALPPGIPDDGFKCTEADVARALFVSPRAPRSEARDVSYFFTSPLSLESILNCPEDVIANQLQSQDALPFKDQNKLVVILARHGSCKGDDTHLQTCSYCARLQALVRHFHFSVVVNITFLPQLITNTTRIKLKHHFFAKNHSVKMVGSALTPHLRKEWKIPKPRFSTGGEPGLQ